MLVVEGDFAHLREVSVLGEASGKIFLDPRLAKAHVIVEGRAQVKDGDRVVPKPDVPPPTAQAETEERGSGKAMPQ